MDQEIKGKVRTIRLIKAVALIHGFQNTLWDQGKDFKLKKKTLRLGTVISQLTLNCINLVFSRKCSRKREFTV